MSSPDVQLLDQFDVALPPSPYPGLRPFEQREWSIFFGRERMTDEVIQRLITQQLVVLHGDSGCGKSSLIRAGVLARLEQEHARGGLSWRTSAMRPANAPLQSLSESLAALDGRLDESRVNEIRRVLNFGAEAPEAVARLLRRGNGDHICILVDQFEELFAFARRQGAEEVTLLVRFLVSLMERRTPGLYAIVTMRSEFLGACAQFAGLAEAVNRAQYLLPRMTNADLLRAIREPASLYGGQVSPLLAERLIADGRGPDELPLIQHGLSALYRRKMASRPTIDPGPPRPDETDGADSDERRTWRLEPGDYVHVESLQKLLSDHANDVTTRCGPALEPIVEQLFRALTAINADGQAVRRPQVFQALVGVTGGDEDSLRQVIDAFRWDDVSFLCPYGTARLRQDALIDISHEALIRHWDLIAGTDGWLAREFRDGLIWRSLLVQADSFEQDPANVLSPATARERERWLAQHNAAWAERYGGGWTRVASLAEASARAARAAGAAARRRLRLLAANVLAGITVLFLAAFIFVGQRQLDRANAAVAESLWDRLDFRSDPLAHEKTAGGFANGPALSALWRIRYADDRQRKAFLEELISREGHEDDLRDRLIRLGQWPAAILRAAAVDWKDANGQSQWTDNIRAGILKVIKDERDTPTIVALLAAVLALPEPDHGQSEQAKKETYDALIDAIDRSGTPLVSPEQRDALALATARLTARQVKEEVERLRALIEGEAELHGGRARMEVLALRLADQDRERTITDLLVKIRDTRLEDISKLGIAVKMDAPRKPSSGDLLHRWAVELDAFLKETDPRRTQPEIAVSLLWSSESYYRTDDYLKAIRDLTNEIRLTNDPLQALDVSLTVIDGLPAPYLPSFKPVVEALVARLAGPQATTALARVQGSIGRASSESQSERGDLLASAAGILATRLPPAETKAEIARALSALQAPQEPSRRVDPIRVPSAAAIAGALAGNMDESQADAATDRLLVFFPAADPVVKERIARAIAPLSLHLGSVQAGLVEVRLLAWLQDERTTKETTSAVIQALGNVTGRRDPKVALDPILEAIKNTDKTADNVRALTGLASIVERLGSRKPDERARNTMKSLLAWSNSSPVSVAAAKAWIAHRPHDRDSDFVKDVAEVLKFPTAAAATEALLAAVAAVVPDAAQLNAIDDRLRWLAHYSGVDLDAPPMCPDPGLVVPDAKRAGLTCPRK